MDRLHRQGLVGPIVERVRGGTWYVGICLGLQLLFERSHEDGAAHAGPAARATWCAIADAPTPAAHRLEPARGASPAPGPRRASRTARRPTSCTATRPSQPIRPIVVAETEHGSRFASLVAHDRILGFQFHPERSGDDGLRMLAEQPGLIGGQATGATDALSGDGGRPRRASGAA